MTTFIDTGFASDEVRKNVPHLIEANAGWFVLVNELIASLQTTAIKASKHVKGSPFDKLPLSLLVLHRANGQVQGAAILLERGMVVEARLLLRALLESAFLMAGIHDNFEIVKAMLIEDMAAAKKGQAKFIVKQGISHKIPQLEERIKEFGKVQNLPIDKLAELGPLKDMYLLYRIISNDAAHPSGKSLSRHMRLVEGGWNGYLLGPADSPEVSETADQLIMAGIALGIAFQQMVGDTENNAILGQVAERYYPLRDGREKAMGGK